MVHTCTATQKQRNARTVTNKVKKPEIKKEWLRKYVNNIFAAMSYKNFVVQYSAKFFYLAARFQIEIDVEQLACSVKCSTVQHSTCGYEPFEGYFIVSIIQYRFLYRTVNRWIHERTVFWKEKAVARDNTNYDYVFVQYCTVGRKLTMDYYTSYVRVLKKL